MDRSTSLDTGAPALGPGPVPYAAPLNGRHSKPIDVGDAYDALADLFLSDTPLPAGESGPSRGPRSPTLPRRVAPRTEPGAPGVPLARPQEPVTIEGLILGHLPVLASAWIMQYARHVAEQTAEPVGVIRLRAGQALVDIVGDAPCIGATPTTLEDAVEAAAPLARIWLVRVDETSEPRMAEMGALDALTLLTGADEAAVVASYRTIRTFFGADDESGEGARRQIKLAIMGSTPEKAADAAGRLARTTEAYLGRKVRTSACIARIGSGRSTCLFKGAHDRSFEETMPRLASLLRSAVPAPRPIAQPPLPTGPDADEAAATRPAESESGSAPRAASRPQPARAEPPDRPERSTTPAAAPLASHLSGLIPTPVACPYTPAVQIALDAEGTVHLLARATPDSDASDDEAVHQLLAAAAWTIAHASLLDLALCATRPRSPGEARVDPSRRPALHLLTDRPRSVRRLLDADLRVHLLAPVEIGGQAGWFCTELN